MRKGASLTFTIIFVVLLAAVMVLIWQGRNDTTDFYENRTLAELPAEDREAILSGDWVGQWETWLTDHVRGRQQIIETDTWLRMKVLRQPVVNGVVVTRDRLLGYNSYGQWDTAYLEESAEETAASLEETFAGLKDSGGTLIYLALPEQYSYFRTYYPSYLENREWLLEPMHAALREALERHDICCVDMYRDYEAMGLPPEFYSTTDHHYAFPGAYAAYRTVMDTVQEQTGRELPVLTEEDLTFTALPNPYLGSRNRKLYGLAYRGEQLIIGEQKDPVPFERYDEGWLSEPYLYELPETPEETITYTVYMGGDHGETILRTDREELPDLLIVGESFTNALEPLLYASFDETRSLDLRYYAGGLSLAEYVAEYQPDVVLIVRDDTAYVNPWG